MEQETRWLSSLLRSVFMGPCPDHQETKNLFCIDCKLEFCKQCEGHSQHRRLQIDRSSSYDVVRLEEIQNHFDCSEIQTYMANGEESVRLKTVHAADEACGRTSMEASNHRFCSIQCKLSLLRAEKTVSSSRIGLENHQDDQSTEVESPLRERADSGNQTSEGTTMQSTLSSADVTEDATTSARTNFRSEERKGTPRRAPFG